MCGITGGIWFDREQSIPHATLERMTDTLRHRGPDDLGVYRREIDQATSIGNAPPAGIGLGFRRLSIIDLAGGHQPLSNEDGTIWVAFNGEIYNYRELRQRLEGSGHRFSSHADTETIVHLYEDLGERCFEHLNGMFAIAIWDARRNRLVLARDRVGKKPLFYASSPGRLAFGSELKSLVELPGVDLSLDPTAIDHYLTYQYIPHPYSIYRGVRKLRPGHFMVVDHDRLDERPFWTPAWDQDSGLTRSQTVEAVRETLTDAVRLRLRSDVPLGAFLSGGIDSSLIVAIAQRELREPIRTFSIGFPEADFDETHYAQQVADAVGSRHRRFEVTPDMLGVLDQLVYHYDEPFSDSSAVPTWYLCRETRSEVTVALSGDGGDELFAGYDRYHALLLSQRVRRWTPSRTLLSLLRFAPDRGNRRSIARRGRRFLEAIGEPPPQRYMNWLQMFGETARGGLYRDDFLEQMPAVDPFDFLHDAWKRVGDRGLVNQASLADLQTYLPGDLMTKVDIASMAHSLEARQPFLDYRLMELSIGTPGSWKMKRGQVKPLLREAFGDLIPEQIWRRKKMGFGVPIAKWFRGELQGMLRQTLCGDDCRLYAFLQREEVHRLVESHLAGRSNEGYRLWNLLILELWLRRWRG